MLALVDKWVWDFWFAQDGGDYHVFYLQAPKSLGDPELRHWNVSIGHAKSRDLCHWDVLPDALTPEQNNVAAPDSFTTWTGCVVRHQHQSHMFYTGTSRAEKGLVQRVCVAQSEDLIHWQKNGKNPVLEIDSRWYDGLIPEYWHDASWRDPWVFLGENAQWHMLITARVNQGAPDGRGAIAHATSGNLIDWQAQAPFFAPGHFGEMEVPQLACIAGRYYLFCSVSAKYHAQTLRQTPACLPQTGLKYYYADTPLGPFDVNNSGFLTGLAQCHLYSGRLIQGPDQTWLFMAFEGYDAAGNFSGRLIDPVEVVVVAGGSLKLKD